jgi:hypothetical protein
MSFIMRKEGEAVAKKLIFLGVLLVVLYAVFHHSEPTASSTSVVNAPGSAPETFAGSDCTGDCSGHQAGYDWAEEKGISDEDDCDEAGDRSNSPSFAEGCKAFVNGDDPSDQGDKDDDDKDDSDNDRSALSPIGKVTKS